MKLIRNSVGSLVAIVDSEDIVDIHNYSTSTNTTTLTIPAIINKDINFVNYGAVAWTLSPDTNEGLTINKSTSGITVNAGKSVSLRYDSLAKNFIIAGSSESTGGGGSTNAEDIILPADWVANPSGGAVTFSENVSSAIEKLQGQHDNLSTSKQNILTAGTNITIDITNPLAPVISASGGGGSFTPATQAQAEAAWNNTSTTSPVVLNNTTGITPLSLFYSEQLIKTYVNGLLTTDYVILVQSADITLPDFTAPEKATNGFTRVWKITGNNVNAININVGWKNIRPDYVPTNNRVSYVYAQAIGGVVQYSVYMEDIPTAGDVTAPTVLSITTDASGYKVLLICDEVMTGTGSFTMSGGNSVSSQSISGNIVTLNVATQIMFGSTGNTLSYTSGLTDQNSNALAAFTNSAITNNTVNNLKSLVGGTLVSGANPAKLAFCTGAGGTDSPFSISIWLKRISNGVAVNFGLSLPFCHTIINPTDNRFSAYVENGSIGLFKSGTTAPTLNSWDHYAITYSGSKTLAGINFYKNGALISGSGVTYGGTYTGGASGSTLTVLGSSNCPHDELAIWSSELSALEVSQIFGNGLTSDARLLSFAASKLKAYFKYDNDILDLSASPVTLTGTPTYSTDIPS